MFILWNEKLFFDKRAKITVRQRERERVRDRKNIKSCKAIQLGCQMKVLWSVALNWYFVGCLNVSYSIAFQYQPTHTERRMCREKKHTPFIYTASCASHRSHRTEVLKQKNTFRLIVHQTNNSTRAVTLFLLFYSFTLSLPLFRSHRLIQMVVYHQRAQDQSAAHNLSIWQKKVRQQAKENVNDGWEWARNDSDDDNNIHNQ